jgi:hypothetical protein
MGIPNATVVQLQEEGIDTVDDLADFDNDTIEQIAANLCRPAGRIPDPNPGVAAGATSATQNLLCLERNPTAIDYRHQACPELRHRWPQHHLQWTPVMNNLAATPPLEISNGLRS